MDQPIFSAPPVFTPGPAEPEPPKKSFPWLTLAVIVFLLAAASVFAYKYFQVKQQLTQTQPLPMPTPSVAASPVADPTANWKTYSNNALGISFKHPSDWVITETDTHVLLEKDPDIRTVVGACPGYSFSVSKYDPYLNYSRFDKVVKSELNSEPTEVWINNDSKCKEKVIFVNSLPSETQKPKYIISFISKNSDSDKTFDLLLPTFKFTPNEPVKCTQNIDPCDQSSCDYDPAKCNLQGPTL